nr:hypothetical protein OG296_35330 [Streptomyces sp. NBC_01001]
MLTGLGNPHLFKRCAELDAQHTTGPAGTAGRTLRLPAHRIRHLSQEIDDLNKRMAEAVAVSTPGLLYWRPGVPSAVKHRPADVVPQPLVVKYEFPDRLRELVTLPSALESSCGLALAGRRGSTCGLDRIGGRTELVRGDVCDSPGLAGRVRGMPCCPTQVSGRTHCMAACRTRLGHLDLASHPGAGMLDRLTRPWVLGLSRLEEVKDVLRARCRPKSEEVVIRISESPTAADRHETRVPDLREDHGWHSFIASAQHPGARTHARHVHK